MKQQHLQRRLGRELALSWLFQVDLARLPPDEVMAEIPDDLEGVEEEGALFARQLVTGVLERQRDIDQAIRKYARAWPLARIGGVERNVLRIALFEIIALPDIPASVSIDEAVEIAKRYGTEESGKFVNGILGAYFRGELSGPETA